MSSAPFGSLVPTPDLTPHQTLGRTTMIDSSQSPQFGQDPLAALDLGLDPETHQAITQDFDYGYNPFQSTTVTLPAAAVDWAMGQCLQMPEGRSRWDTLLRALGLQGVAQWLATEQGRGALVYDRQTPPVPTTLAQVNGFRLALVVQGSLSDEWVQIPVATATATTEFAHLYVLVEVEEETNQVTILGGLRRDRLLALREQGAIAPTEPDTYRVSLQAFDTPAEALLLYLNCLEPEALAGPSAAIAAPGVAALSEQLINVGHWFQDQLDIVAETLSWALLPPLDLAPALRYRGAAMEAMETVLQALELEGVSIPGKARGAYTDVQAQGMACRLYALTWPLTSPTELEWSLFLCLGGTEGDSLAPGTRLMVADGATPLTEQTLTQDRGSTYLYTQVIGTWEERFTVTVALPNGHTLHWPPFVFRPAS